MLRLCDENRLPDYPLVPGVAGAIAGFHDKVLIAAGGANFPNRLPWEGGIKVFHDTIYALPSEQGAWRHEGHLPAPLAYAAAVSLDHGVLAIGGETASGVSNACWLLRWTGRRVEVEPAAPLPEPATHVAAAELDGKVYAAGGLAPGSPRLGLRQFLCLDFAHSPQRWAALPPWPGPARAHSVMTAVDDAVYLMSGIEVSPGATGSPQHVYLTDAYRYRPGGAWELLPPMPWSTVAAPSPAPATQNPARFFVLGGVDGRRVGQQPADTPVPGHILCLDIARNEWHPLPEAWRYPVVAAPMVAIDGQWVVVSGETMAGRRTRVVQAWQPGPTRS